MNQTPDAYVLKNVNWNLFATLTFSEGSMSDRRRYHVLFAWLRTVAETYGQKFGDSLWCTRRERGETFGRVHFHALLAGLCDSPTQRDVFRVLRLWESFGAGFGLVRRFNNALDGIDYMTDPNKAWTVSAADGLTSGELTRRGSHAAANAYEALKFDSMASEVEIARAVFRHVGGRRGIPVEGERNWRLPARAWGQS